MTMQRASKRDTKATLPMTYTSAGKPISLINKRRKNTFFSPTKHYTVLLTVFFVGILVCTYLLLSSKEEKINKVKLAAAAHSATNMLSSGKPFIVYGTAWKKEMTAQYVSDAIHAGFRFIDTACQPKHYNEAGVGYGWVTAAQELGLERSDLFLQTKYTSYSGQDPNNIPYDHHAPVEQQVEQSLAVSLKNLQTTYLDSLVMHSPMDTMEDTMKVWRVMESFVDDGKVRRIGISNIYDYEKFKTLYNQARIKPWVVQNRFYQESNFDTELRNFLKENGVKYQSFWTLTANRKALAKAEVKELAKAKGLSPQTYMFAFLMSLGYITPLSGTTNKVHMAEDVAVMERMQGGDEIITDEKEKQLMAQFLGLPNAGSPDL